MPVLLSLVLCYSCDRPKLGISYSETEVNIFPENKVMIGENLLSLQRIDDKTIAGFDHLLSKIVLIDKEGHLNLIPLFFEGPNALPKGAGSNFVWISPDSLIILEHPYLYLLNSKGELYNKWGLIDNTVNQLSCVVSTHYYVPPQRIANSLDRKKSKLYLGLLTNTGAYSIENKVIVELDLISENCNLLPVYIPIPESSKGSTLRKSFLDKITPQPCLKGDSLLVSYGHTSKIICYNRENKEISEVNVSGIPGGIFSDAFSGNAKSMKERFDFLRSNNFNSIHYLDNNNIFCRIRFGEFDSTINRMSLLLVVYDEDFKFIGEIPLSHEYRPTMINFGDRLWLHKISNDVEGVLSFSEFRFK